MNIQEAYDDWSATYDTDLNLTRDLDQTSTEQALADLQFNAILEIGCGTGKNTRFLSQIGGNVFALDFSAGMINKAKEKVGSTNVHYSVTDLRSVWPCKTGSFELVTCNLVLEHIEDLAPVFSEAYRVLKNGGQFYISELHPFRQYQGKKARFERGAQTVEVDAFVHHLSEFFNTAGESGFILGQFRELWHAEDGKKLPRLVSLMFRK
jgi:malonyl-CoA O-methyltransferase